ncbi:MAG: hypothetical protein KA715_08020 [Xanthomonadaceae bacterium]|nr:hypothetical protein [Xanthomonadaceae bacterium]
MKMTLLLILLSSAYSYAHGLQLKSSGSDFYLFSSSCAALEKQYHYIRQFKKRSDRKTLPEKINCLSLKEGDGYRLYLNELLPEKMQSLLRLETSKGTGGTCWNSVQYLSGHTPTLRYTTPEEIKEFYDSGLCRERTNTEVPEPGDVIRLKVSDDRSLKPDAHSFIYISPELSFTKNGVNPYSIQMTEDVYNNYGIKKECQNPTKENLAYCTGYTYSRVYGCFPLKRISDSQKDMEVFSDLEVLIEDYQLGKIKFTLSLEDYNEKVSFLLAIKSRVQTALVNSRDDHVKYWYKILLFRIESLLGANGLQAIPSAEGVLYCPVRTYSKGVGYDSNGFRLTKEEVINECKTIIATEKDEYDSIRLWCEAALTKL